MNTANFKKYITQYDTYTMQWRKIVKAGDYTTEGLEIKVNSVLVLIQTKYGEKWFNLNVLFPIRCVEHLGMMECTIILPPLK